MAYALSCANPVAAQTMKSLLGAEIRTYWFQNLSPNSPPPITGHVDVLSLATRG